MVRGGGPDLADCTAAEAYQLVAAEASRIARHNRKCHAIVRMPTVSQIPSPRQVRMRLSPPQVRLAAAMFASLAWTAGVGLTLWQVEPRRIQRHSDTPTRYVLAPQPRTLQAQPAPPRPVAPVQPAAAAPTQPAAPPRTAQPTRPFAAKVTKGGQVATTLAVTTTTQARLATDETLSQLGTAATNPGGEAAALAAEGTGTATTPTPATQHATTLVGCTTSAWARSTHAAIADCLAAWTGPTTVCAQPTRVRLALGAAGSLTAPPAVVRSCGDAVADQQLLDAVQRCPHWPARPPHCPAVTLDVPLRFVDE